MTLVGYMQISLVELYLLLASAAYTQRSCFIFSARKVLCKCVEPIRCIG